MNVVFYYSQITFRRVELFLGQKSFKLLLFSLRASFVFCLSSHLHAAGHSFLWITSDALSTAQRRLTSTQLSCSTRWSPGWSICKSKQLWIENRCFEQNFAAAF